jgi:methionyl-tRNA formyltransferase
VRTVFLGTSEFAAAVLTGLAAAGGAHRPRLVLTRPDRPAGRGRRLNSPPVAEVARELGLELAQPENVNDACSRELIAAAGPRVVVVCAFGALIREPLLREYELLNVHPSLLPRWRGAAPIERAIMAGDAETGVSIMRVTAGLDSGPVCAAVAEPIGADDSYGTLTSRLERLGAALLADALDRLDAGRPLSFVAQDEHSATYAEKIGPVDRLLDPARPAVELERVVRALHPHIGARVALADGTWLRVHRAALVSADDSAPTAADAPAAPADAPHDPRSAVGVYVSGERLLLACSPGTLELLSVQPPGGRPMDAGAFLRGHGLSGA